MNRFDLEERITEYSASCEEMVETLIYMIGDSPEKPTEDELLNVLIGFKDAQKFRYNRLWNVFENLIENHTITSKGTPSYTPGGQPTGSPEITEQYQQ